MQTQTERETKPRMLLTHLPAHNNSQTATANVQSDTLVTSDDRVKNNVESAGVTRRGLGVYEVLPRGRNEIETL